MYMQIYAYTYTHIFVSTYSLEARIAEYEEHLAQHQKRIIKCVENYRILTMHHEERINNISVLQGKVSQR